MITFPAWFKPDPDKPPVLFHTEASVPKGWSHFPGSYNFQTGQWIDAPPDDGDGRDMKALRADYLAKFGKRPFNGWKEAVLRERLSAESVG
jgi:hypothetical protein